MPSKQSIELAQLVIAMGEGGATVHGGIGGDLASFLADQIDVAVELAKECHGKPNPAMLAIALSKKGPGLVALAGRNNDLAKCMAAVSSLSLSIAATVISTSTGVGLFAFGLSALADLYSMNESCTGPAKAAFNKATDKVVKDPENIRRYHELMDFFQIPGVMR